MKSDIKRDMNKEKLKIKKLGEDGNRVITIRIRESILAKIDNLAKETHRSRNELVNIILDYGANNIEIEEDK